MVPTRVAVIPDLNQDEKIAAIATTAGAWAGALTTAGVGGILTGVVSAFKGAVMGAQVTYANAGSQQVAVAGKATNRAIAEAGVIDGPVGSATVDGNREYEVVIIQGQQYLKPKTTVPTLTADQQKIQELEDKLAALMVALGQ